MQIRVITFDFWNTLFVEDKEKSVKRQELRRELIVRATGLKKDEVLKVFKEVSSVFEQILREAYQAFTPEDFVSEVLKRLGVSLKREELKELVNSIEEAILPFPPLLIDHLHPTIENLSKAYRLGIVSNAGLSPGRALREIIRREGLLRYFKSFSFSNETGVMKPNPEAFLKVLKELDTRPEEAVHIGDLERTDIEGAKRLRMKAILFNKDKGETRADSVIDSFDKLPEILRRIKEAIV